MCIHNRVSSTKPKRWTDVRIRPVDGSVFLGDSTDFHLYVTCKLHMTYGFLLLFVFVWTISYHMWLVYIDLYYLQLFSIIAYHFNLAHIIHLQMPYHVIYMWKSVL